MRPLKLVPDNTNFDFMRWRHIAAVFSTLMVVASIALLFLQGLNFGVDFVGGQLVRVEFAQPIPIEQVRGRIDALGLGDSSIQQFGSDREMAVRLPLPTAQADADAQTRRIRAEFPRIFPNSRIVSVEAVSGKVSGELFQKGALALFIAMIAVAIYIWLRFEWQFGVGALLALAQDIIVTLGFFALTQLEFDLNTVAALLTIIGYSLNDKIVIFDRVRENLRKYRKMDIVQILNLSTNETLSRTVMTSLSLLLALASLVILGPDVIFGFSLAMLLGVIIGTYSSVYVGNGILIQFKVGPESFGKARKSGVEGAERVTAREPATPTDRP